jgi:GIGANTEA
MAKSSFPFQKEYSEQWALACGEILRVLTHYNRPIYKTEHQNNDEGESSSSNNASTSSSKGKETDQSSPSENERKPFRPLTPWITDILLAAPLGIRSDYFRWYINLNL